jgi:hypothetical protein
MRCDRLRFLPLVAVCSLVAAGAAQAQTVILRKAAAGSPAELVVNTEQVASGTVGADGLVTLTAPSTTLGQRQIDARVYLDVCGATRRVIITERGVTPAPSGACGRTQLEGLFHVQRISSLVIDVSVTPPSMLLRQGRAPDAWLVDPVEDAPGPSLLADGRTGMMLFGGIGTSTFRDYAATNCGLVQTCSVNRAPLLGTVGVTYWAMPFIGVEASFVRPGRLTASSDASPGFDSDMVGGVVTVAGIGGIPLGPVRIFGKLGAAYHRATHETTQRSTDQLIAVEGNPVLIPGSSQTFSHRTQGWGAVLGAGMEYWVGPRWAFYGELGQVAIKGKQADGGEGTIDDLARYATVGARIILPALW